MKNDIIPYLFEQDSMPDFGNQRLPHNVWNRIKYKLDLFQENGGILVNPITQTNDDFNLVVDFAKNCFSEAMGIDIVGGTHCLEPGCLKNVLHGRDKPVHKITFDKNYKKYVDIDYDPKAFHEKMIADLNNDGIKLNIPLDQIGLYYPCIGYTYLQNIKYSESVNKDDDLDNTDFHFIAVGKSTDSNNSYTFSERPSKREPINHYTDEKQFITENFDRSLYKADVFFVPKDLIGTKIEVTSAVKDNSDFYSTPIVIVQMRKTM
jgi:hypothetical protein